MEGTKLIVATLVAVLVSGGVLLTQATGQTAQARAGKYYAALEAGDFDTAWTFFGSRMRADNARSDYVEHAARSLAKVRVLKGPIIQVLESTGTQQRPLARVVTRVLFTTKDGKQTEASHTTEWVWQRSPDSKDDNWFLARDRITEGRASSDHQ